MILKRINQELSRNTFPITSDQFSTLIYVLNQNGQPQYALAETLNKDKTTMARVLAGLESLGLIVRRPGNSDAREKNVFLTDQGRKMMNDITDLVQGILESATEGIDPDNIEVTKDVLRKFYRNLL